MKPPTSAYLVFWTATLILACDTRQQVVIRAAAGFQKRGDVAEAERLLLGLVSVLERADVVDQSCLPVALNNLGSISQDLGRYRAAEIFYSRALRIEERESSGSADIAATLDNLGSVYFETGQHRKAESVRLRALDIRVAKFGPTDPGVARILQNLATQKYAQGQFKEASKLYGRALVIWQVAGLQDTAECATALNGLGLIYAKAGDLNLATEHLRLALEILRAVFRCECPGRTSRGQSGSADGQSRRQ